MMTQEEKLVARLQSQPEDGLYEIRIAIVDGKILFWLPPEFVGNMEGLPKTVKIEERKEIEYDKQNTGLVCTP